MTSAQKVSIQSLLGPSQSSPSKPQQKSRKKPNKNGKDTEIPPSTTPDPKRKVKVAENQTGSPSPEDSEDPVVRSKGTRGSRTRKTDNLKIGFYTADEVRKIEAYKVNFCTLHGVSSTTFDEMVQHSERTTTGDFPVSSEVITKAEFWKEIYGLVPDRDRRSVYRFMRRHFQASAQKAHDWSKEQEEELIDLVAQHGPKWTYIGKLIGRSDDDVTQRWKNKLEHQATMRQGAWSEEETRTFLNAVESSWQTMKPMFPERAGKDLYEVDERLIIWGNISKEMEHTRSRQQCADKWRKIVRQVMTMRANGQPDAVYDPRLAAKKAANWNTRLENQRKSSQFVDDSDGDEIMNTGVASPLPESQDVIGTTSASGGSVASDHEVQSQEDEVDLPEPPKKTKNSNSKRKRTEEPTAATETKEMSSPVASKTDKKEKKREKKERQEKLNREKELEDQMEEEAKEKEEKAARKVNKRKRKQEKRKRREEEERLAAEASSSEAEVTAPPKKKKS